MTNLKVQTGRPGGVGEDKQVEQRIKEGGNVKT